MANLCISYLHRDEGNYKTFYEAVFPNAQGCTPEEVERQIRPYLIDHEYFYPQRLRLPFVTDTDPAWGNAAWAEWEGIRETDAEADQKMDIKDFLYYWADRLSLNTFGLWN